MADELFRGWWINRFPNRILDSTEHSDFNRWAIAYTLKSWGWSDVAAAGVVANVIHESFANPACWEYCADVEHQNYAGSCGYIPGAYLFAWTPWTKWGDYAAAHGMEEYDGCAQMQFLIDTLSEYWFLYDHYGLGSDLFPTWEDYAYRNDYTPEIAARAWCSYYEKPNEDPAINHIAERIASAQEWYTKITPNSRLPVCPPAQAVAASTIRGYRMQGCRVQNTGIPPQIPFTRNLDCQIVLATLGADGGKSGKQADTPLRFPNCRPQTADSGGRITYHPEPMPGALTHRLAR